MLIESSCKCNAAKATRSPGKMVRSFSWDGWCLSQPGWGYQHFWQWGGMKSGEEFVWITQKLPFFSALLLCQRKCRQGGRAHASTRRMLWRGKPENTTVALPCPWGMREQREGKVKSNLVLSSCWLQTKWNYRETAWSSDGIQSPASSGLCSEILQSKGKPSIRFFQYTWDDWLH